MVVTAQVRDDLEGRVKLKLEFGRGLLGLGASEVEIVGPWVMVSAPAEKEIAVREWLLSRGILDRVQREW